MSNRNKNTNRRATSSATHRNPIRVRGKRLDQVDDGKLTLAYWLLAKKLVENKSDLSDLTEAEVRKVADRLQQQADDEVRR